MRNPEVFDHDGLVWLDLGREWPGFNEALADSVSTLSPRGESPALSTYWIDHALSKVASRPGTEVSSGNATRLVRTDEGIRARSDYELFEDEEMPVEHFVRLLQVWRSAVVERIEASDPKRPQQAPYQRNPPG